MVGCKWMVVGNETNATKQQGMQQSNNNNNNEDPPSSDLT